MEHILQLKYLRVCCQINFMFLHHLINNGHTRGFNAYLTTSVLPYEILITKIAYLYQGI